MLSTAILAWLHIISAMMWLGGGIMFAVIVAPALAKLSLASSGEFFVKVVPRVARFFQIVAGTTILFGIPLMHVGISNGGFPGLDLSTKWGLSMTIGLSIGVAAFLISELLAVPPLLKVVKMIKEMQASGQHQTPAELPKTLRRASLTANTAVILVVLTLVFMVSAGFY